jgi:hypothetical protein
MSFAKLTLACGLAATTLAACASAVKPVAGTLASTGKPLGRGVVDDPRTHQPNYVKCLQSKEHLPVQKVGPTDLQIGPLPAGPTIHFAITPGIAEGLQITAKEQSAEVINSALLYPNQASDTELKKIEDCLSTG